MTDETNNEPPVQLEGRIVMPPGRRFPGLLSKEASLALVGGAVVAGAFALGMDFPDWDQPHGYLSFLDHRSALTHSILVPWLLRRQIQNLPMGRYLYAGIMAGLAVHLTADMFPAAWMGYALVTFPLFGSMGPLFSFLFLLINAAVAARIVARCFSGTKDVPVFLVSVVAISGFWYVLSGSSLLLALLVLSLGALIFYVHKPVIREKAEHGFQKATDVTRKAGVYVRDHKVTKDLSAKAEPYRQKAADAALKAGEIVRDHKVTKELSAKARHGTQRATEATREAGVYVRDHKVTKDLSAKA
ncbi:MAG: metal-dependent hydrolase, partial [Alphaproteobacteria bacterium]|nr:metal-dependent hydrolase [Alphaproteobacteria bacterium]